MDALDALHLPLSTNPVFSDLRASSEEDEALFTPDFPEDLTEWSFDPDSDSWEEDLELETLLGTVPLRETLSLVEPPSPSPLPAWTPLPRSLTDRISAEIVDNIVGQLKSDKGSLAACSLVGWPWLRASRYHFGRKLVDIGGGNVEELGELLDTPRSALFRSSLRVIRLWESDRLPLSPIPPHLLTLPIHSLQCFPVAHQHAKIQDIKALYLGLAQTLTELIICEAPVDSLSELAHLLPSLPVLRHVALLELDWSDDALPEYTDESPRPESPMSLRSLILTRSSVNLLNWLLAAEEKPALTSLDLRCGYWPGSDGHPDGRRVLNPIPGYFEALGASLRHLDFYGLGPKTKVDLSLTPHLRSLWFHRAHPKNHPDFSDWFTGYLATITSSCVEYIRLDTRDPILKGLDQIAWSSLSEVLQRDNFSQLKKFVITFDPMFIDAEQTGAFVKNMLPELDAKGILHVAEYERYPKLGLSGRVSESLEDYF